MRTFLMVFKAKNRDTISLNIPVFVAYEVPDGVGTLKKNIKGDRADGS